MEGRAKGMSLIELLIVVAVVGILAGIAYPGYSEKVRKAARTEIAGVLLDSAQHLQRHHSRAGRYTDTETLVTPLPAGTGHYHLLAERQADGYRLTATRRAGGLMADDACGDYQLDHRGSRSNPGQAGAADLTCWGS